VAYSADSFEVNCVEQDTAAGHAPARGMDMSPGCVVVMRMAEAGATAEWARQWPAEEIWAAHLTG